MTDIAEAYGKTLYSLANECEATEEILGQIAVLRQAFAENPKYLTLMGAPTLKKEERVALVDEAFDGKQFRKEYNWEHGIETVTVVSAVALDAAQEAELTAKLRSLTGKEIHLEKRVDPSVLGGLRLQMEGLQMDGTVKNKLDAIRSKLLHSIA